jgi:hypothetical protein
MPLRRYFTTRYSDSALRRIKKGKEVICVKTNMKNGVTGRPVARKQNAFLPLAFWLLHVRL